MKTDVPIKAEVRCDDGPAGTSDAVILDPIKREVTHVVLRERGWPNNKRLVPVELIAWTTEDEIHLRCPMAATRTLRSFVETQFVEAPDVGGSYPILPDDGLPYLWPFAYPNQKVLLTHERIPKDELAIRRDAEVDATDGRVGRVEAFLVDADDDHITHVVVRSGHLAHHEFAVPVSDVAEISEERIMLRLDRYGVEDLPHVPYHHIALLPGIDEGDGDLVPESPREAGVVVAEPDPSHLEAAHLLAQEAEQRLESRGFTRDQILDWTRQYLRAGRNGGVDELVAWIDDQEHRRVIPTLDDASAPACSTG
jgi:uncharacterized protein YrrD